MRQFRERIFNPQKVAFRIKFYLHQNNVQLLGIFGFIFIISASGGENIS